VKRPAFSHRAIKSIEADGLRIQVNGDPREVYATTVAELVEELALDPRKVAVERNLEIVPRSLYAVTALAEGDRIELVQFVGGG
jgi:sulfur carrier protein